MSATRYTRVIGATLLTLSMANAVQGQERSAPAGAMPGMQMPGAEAAKPGESATELRDGYAPTSTPPAVQQRIGVKLGTAEEAPLTMTIRTVGIVRPDETKVAHIHLKTDGWVEKLFVSFTGQTVKVGDPMLSIYSPAFYSAQREFLSALRSSRSGDQQSVLVDTARQRLELWDVPQEAIEALEKTGKPAKSLILRSPISGTVIEKKAFAGQYVMTQAELFVVAELSTVWMQAKVFEHELPHIELGMPATVSFPSLPKREFIGKVVFIDPIVDEMSRSVQVRIELSNPDGQFRPGMFGRIVLAQVMGRGLTVPTSAVIRTGERDIVFRAIAPDRFAPVQVKIGPIQFENRFLILEGLKAGDQVVTSANFLIDSESRLEAGGGSMAGMPGMTPEPPKSNAGNAGAHEGHKGPAK